MKRKGLLITNICLITMGSLFGLVIAMACDIAWHTFYKPLRYARVLRASRYDESEQQKFLQSINQSDYSFLPYSPPALDFVDRTEEWQGDFFTPSYIELKPSTCSPSRTRLGRSGMPLWDHEYCTTDKGYRKTPEVDPQATKEKFLAIIGCSFTFGLGVADHQTLPAQLSKYFPSHQMYNFGYPAASLAEFLADSYTNPDPIWHDVQEPHGTFVYYFLDVHIQRFTRSLMAMRDITAGKRPVFSLGNDDTEPMYLGTSKALFPYSTKAKLYFSRSAILRSIHFDYPSVTSHHIEQYARIVASFKRKLLGRYNNASFIVVLDPTMDSYPLFSEELKRLGIAKIDYSLLDFRKILGADTTIPYDGHPTANYHRVLAEILSRDLIAGDALH
jgi:hypothetical protein